MVKIRRAEYKDLTEIMKLDEECFGESYSFDMWEELLNDFILLLAFDENKLIGCISVIKNIKDISNSMSKGMMNFMNKMEIKECYLIASICVLKNYRGTGIGTELIRRAIKKTKGYILLNVRVSNEKAIKFYKRHNFLIYDYVEIDYYSNPKEDSYLMYMKN